jgi:UDP-N-acetylglucosamine 2-epimerase (non-hydrolysing)/GDP/UDP-N,N'-diacetylbacillosamine 2-epimerase (hydrolysing)
MGIHCGRATKIAVVTGSRAEYGLLAPVMEGLAAATDFELVVVAAAMHLSPEFGLTFREIESAGFSIHARVEMLLSSDTAVGAAKSLGLGVIGFAEAFDRLTPDLVLILGDRFEILAAAQAALLARIPVGHIAGGDCTEGAVDESIRHAITKMSHLHFATNSAAAQRIRQLGENPDYIFITGSPGIDALLAQTPLSRKELASRFGLFFSPRNFLITFHPETLAERPASEQLAEILRALDDLGPEVGLFFTLPNADVAGRALAAMVEDFSQERSNAFVFASLGQRGYLSLMAQVDAVVGNSSSGLYEAPSLRVPTVDIGDRQKGRLAAASVLRCPAERRSIGRAIARALEMDCSGVVNPYGDGRATERILEALRHVGDLRRLARKPFFELGGGAHG